MSGLADTCRRIREETAHIELHFGDPVMTIEIVPLKGFSPFGSEMPIGMLGRVIAEPTGGLIAVNFGAFGDIWCERAALAPSVDHGG